MIGRKLSAELVEWVAQTAFLLCGAAAFLLIVLLLITPGVNFLAVVGILILSTIVSAIAGFTGGALFGFITSGVISLINSMGRRAKKSKTLEHAVSKRFEPSDTINHNADASADDSPKKLVDSLGKQTSDAATQTDEQPIHNTILPGKHPDQPEQPQKKIHSKL